MPISDIAKKPHSGDFERKVETLVRPNTFFQFPTAERFAQPTIAVKMPQLDHALATIGGNQFPGLRLISMCNDEADADAGFSDETASSSSAASGQ
jgi:hypothetical protein